MCTDVHTPPNTLEFVRARGVPELELSSRECVRPLKLGMPASLVSYGSHNFWTPTHSDKGKCVGVCIWETSAEQHMPRHIGRVETASLHALTGSAPLAVTDARTLNRPLSSRRSPPWRSSPGRVRATQLCGSPLTTCLNSHLLTPAHRCSVTAALPLGKSRQEKTPCFPMKHWAAGGFLWRYRWDLNPRWSLPHTTFRELHLRPLGHGTEEEFS